jgi:hypothetical protein
MYRIKLPIGDWSGDGHRECEQFIVESTKPVEEIREAHFKIKEVTDIDICKICSEYGDSYIREGEIEKILATGFVFDEGHCNEIEKDGENIISISPLPTALAELWVYLLNKIDNSLQLRIVDDNVPMLPFYGFDEKGRHISGVGYGLFGDEY